MYYRKTMKTLLLPYQLIFLLLIGGVSIGFGQGVVKGYAAKPVYEAGQVWSYKTRLDEKASTLVILKVEYDKELGKIVHIALRDLKMKRSGGGLLTRANHLPFAESAINESVVKMLSKDEELPNFLEGYDLWKKAFDAKEASVYTIPVAEAVEAMESTFNR